MRGTGPNPGSGPRSSIVSAAFKSVFGFTKVHDRGLEKNADRVFVACALVNLFIVRTRLLHA
jgi:IS5 family transposase